MAKEKELEIEEADLIDDELIQESLLEESDETEEGEDHHEESRLDSKKLLLLVGLGIFSFIIFFLFTFPLDEIVRSMLASSSKETGITIEAKEIHFPFLGRKSFDSFSIQLTNGTVIKAEESSLSVSLLGLLGNRLEGDAEIGFLKYDGGEWSVQMRSIIFPIKLSSIDEKITKWNGEGEIEMSGGKFLESMEIPLVGSLKGYEIKKISVQFKIRAGKVLIEKGSIDSSLARIQFNGVIRLSDIINLSQLDIKMCGTLNEKFALERQDIAGLATLLPQENGKICIPVRGSLSSPKIDVPNLNQLGTPSIQTEPAPTQEIIPPPVPAN